MKQSSCVSPTRFCIDLFDFILYFPTIWMGFDSRISWIKKHVLKSQSNINPLRWCIGLWGGPTPKCPQPGPTVVKIYRYTSPSNKYIIILSPLELLACCTSYHLTILLVLFLSSNILYAHYSFSQLYIFKLWKYSPICRTMEAMVHSSSFLLPEIPAGDGDGLKYALVLLNQRLPKFTPLLWKHGTLQHLLISSSIYFQFVA